MKQVLLILMIGFMTACTAEAQQANKQIEKVVKQFVKGGDQNDTEALGKVLHDQHRITLKDLKSGAVKVVDRATYIKLVGNKTFGGDKRKIEIESIEVFDGEIATVKAKLVGSKATFYNFLSLVKVDGEWKIVQDLVFMK